jgi:hypothetical protein
MSRPNASGQELPLEVVLSLQRILRLQNGNDADDLDSVAGQFDTVNYLNNLFPTGRFISSGDLRIDINRRINSGDSRGIPRRARGCSATSG